MWQCVKRLMVRLNRDRQWSLKAGGGVWGGGGYVTHFYSSANHFENDLISAVHQKSYNG